MRWWGSAGLVAAAARVGGERIRTAGRVGGNSPEIRGDFTLESARSKKPSGGNLDAEEEALPADRVLCYQLSGP